MTALNPASAEQKAIVTAIEDTNIIIDAVAGSGKTTTVLHIAAAYPGSKILLLTYNSRLKMETRERAKSCAIDNLEVHSFHSFGFKYISRSFATDEGLHEFLKDPFKIASPAYNVVIIDEVQDLTPSLYEFTLYIVGGTSAPRIAILGDWAQCIYQFNGADERHILHADKLYAPEASWERLKLSTTYRVTRESSAFVNEAMLGSSRLIGVRSGPKPEYRIINMFNIKTCTSIVDEMLGHGYTPADIFIIAASCRVGPKAPLSLFENALVAKGIPVFTPADDDAVITKEIVENKLSFITMHQAKGLERKVVLVFGFDASYFQYYARDFRADVCPNTLYIAATRASERLILLHAQGKPPLPFLDLAAIKRTCTVRGKLPEHADLSTKEPPPDYSVTQLLRHLKSSVVNEAISMMTFNEISPPGKRIIVKSESRQTHPDTGVETVEDVSDINGVAVPTAYAYAFVEDVFDLAVVQHLERLKCKSYTVPCDGEDIEGFMCLSMIYHAETSGYNGRVNQIHDCNWMKPETFEKLRGRLAEYVGAESSASPSFEQCLETIIVVPCLEEKVRLRGAIDIIHKDSLYEIKVVSSLKDTHKLQLALYAYLQMANKEETLGVSRYRIFNVTNGHEIELMLDTPQRRAALEQAIFMLIKAKRGKAEKISTATFLERVATTRARMERIEEGDVEHDIVEEGDESALDECEITNSDDWS